MQCFTWALTTPHRTIFSRSGTKHGHHEAADGVWNVSVVWDFCRGKSVSMCRGRLVWCCWLEGLHLHIRLHS